MLVQHRTRTTAGFTLVELMVTVAIVAVLTTLALPSMRQFIGNWQLSNALNAFIGSLQIARAEAVKRGRNVRMCRSNNGRTCGVGNNLPGGWTSGWIVYVDNDGSGAGVSASDQIILTQGVLTNFDSIVAINPSAFSFTPTGLLQSGVGMQTMVFSWDIDGEIQKSLCISFTGRARIARESTDCTGG